MNLITAREASEKYGLTDRWIRMLIRRGDIPAVRIGNVWAFDYKAVQDYLANKRSKGWPKGRQRRGVKA